MNSRKISTARNCVLLLLDIFDQRYYLYELNFFCDLFCFTLCLYFNHILCLETQQANFPSLDSLIEKIHEDGRIAERALDLPCYSKYRDDPFLRGSPLWWHWSNISLNLFFLNLFGQAATIVWKRNGKIWLQCYTTALLSCTSICIMNARA